MSTVAGYTICFTAQGQLRQVTVAERDDDKIEQILQSRFGEIQVLSRMAIDARVLALLDLRRGQWIEWMQMAHRRE